MGILRFLAECIQTLSEVLFVAIAAPHAGHFESLWSLEDLSSLELRGLLLLQQRSQLPLEIHFGLLGGANRPTTLLDGRLADFQHRLQREGVRCHAAASIALVPDRTRSSRARRVASGECRWSTVWQAYRRIASRVSTARSTRGLLPGR